MCSWFDAQMKGVEKAHMNRLVIKAILKTCGKAIVLTTIVGVIIVIIGNINGWNASIAYSNAFFVAGVFVIAGGLASRLNPNQDVHQFRLFSSAGSFRNMSTGERRDYIVYALGPTNLVIVCLLSAILLLLISELISKMF